MRASMAVSAARLRVFVFEPHALGRQALQELLECEGFEVAGASGGAEEAVRTIEYIRPDVCLLSLGCGGDAIGVCGEVTAASGVPCVMLAGHRDPRTVAAAARARARGFVLKEIRASGIPAALRSAASA